MSTGKFEFTMPDGFSAVTESITLRSSPGTLECRFISQEQGTETHEFNVSAKIVGVSREVWECYSDDTINRHGDIGCAGREDERVVKWDLDRPLRVWATGDPDYIDVLWGDARSTLAVTRHDLHQHAISRRRGPEGMGWDFAGRGVRNVGRRGFARMRPVARLCGTPMLVEFLRHGLPCGWRNQIGSGGSGWSTVELST